MAVKRKLTQEDLRKAMNEHKKKLGIVKKIESPLAKYTEAGQLMCILCKSVVRNETVWPVHLNSKTHKENIMLAKKTKLEPDQASKAISSSSKRPLSPAQDPSTNKKVKSILKNTTQPSVQSQQALPADFFDNASKPNSILSSVSTAAVQSTENSREFVNSVENKSIEIEDEKEKEKSKETNQAILPEGFFDDPVLDAKVRNVEYKDPIEEEWEKFQKEIKEETAQSAKIIADDQEEATTERQIDEIEEQIRHWSRVMDLVKRKEQVQATDRKQESTENEVSSEDESEFDEFLDWRAKNSYK